MRRRASGILLAVILIGLSLLVARIIDVYSFPEHVIALPYAIPILIAAYRVPSRGIVITTILTIVVALVSAFLGGAPILPAVFHLGGLLIVGTLAVLLGAARQRTADVLNSMTDAVYALDHNWRITYLNPQAMRLVSEVLRRPPSTIMRHVLWETFPELIGTETERELRRAMVERTTVVVDTYAQSTGAWLELQAYPSARGLSIYARDITARRESEAEQALLLRQVDRERNWLSTVIERSPVGIIRVEGPRGERILANRQVEHLFGRSLSPEKGVAQYADQIYHIDGTPLKWGELAIVRALKGERIVGSEDVLLRRPDGTTARVRVNAVPIREGEAIVGAVVIVEDITEIRELERLREEWISLITHDLRQPVTIILGYAGFLAHDLQPTAHTKDIERAITHILASARNLNKMIGDLLDASRIEARRLTLHCQSTDLTVLVQAVAERAREITAGHTMRVEIHGDVPPVMADPSRVEQVLINLLSNAATYGFADSPIVVQVSRRDDNAEVSVINRGPGIPPSELPHLFTRFYRTPQARVGPRKGLGLGLYICKGIVEAHGGKIWAESVPNAETTFTFILPLAKSGEPSTTHGSSLRGFLVGRALAHPDAPVYNRDQNVDEIQGG